MTDDERRDPVTVSRVTGEELKRMPEVRAGDLEFGLVYVIEGERHIATMNYAGKSPMLHPVTLDTVMGHRFDAPRIPGFHVAFMAASDGRLYSADGTFVIVRKWTGEE